MSKLLEFPETQDMATAIIVEGKKGVKS